MKVFLRTIGGEKVHDYDYTSHGVLGGRNVKLNRFYDDRAYK